MKEAASASNVLNRVELYLCRVFVFIDAQLFVFSFGGKRQLICYQRVSRMVAKFLIFILDGILFVDTLEQVVE